MSEKQFDDIENKIREAAAIEPEYNELAWSKMEQLLDKEDDNKRPVLWVVIVCCVVTFVGGGLYFNNKTDQHTSRNEAIVNTIQSKTSPSSVVQKEMNPVVPMPVSEAGQGTVVITPKNVKAKQLAILATSSKSILQVNNILRQNKNSSNLGTALSGDEMLSVNKPVRIDQKSKTLISVRSNIASLPTGQETIGDSSILNNQAVVNSAVAMIVIKPMEKDTAEKSLLPKDNAGKIIKDPSQDKKIADKQNKKQPARFYFLAGFGADASNVHAFSLKNSTITAKYGLGVGYQVNKRISIQAGVFVSQKKYIAGPGDYKLSSDPYWNTAKIIKVDADCKVVEIPFNVRYNLKATAARKLFITSGLSSYIMKKEDYTYQYTRYNYPYTKAMSYTGNKNIFSILRLSAGVEQKLTSTISVMVEPSVNIPLTGIGNGQVKLYSLGLQAGVVYRPKKHR